MIPSEPGRIGTPASRIIAARARSFTPMGRITSGSRPDELHAGGFADLGEIRVLAEKSVAGMDGVDIGNFRGADDGGNVQIAAGTLGWADTNGFVRKANVQAVPIGLGINSNGGDAKILAGADDAERDLSAVGDQDFSNRAGPKRSMANRASPYSTAGRCRRTCATIVPLRFRLDLVHQFHGFDDAEHVARFDGVPNTDERGRAWGCAFVKRAHDGRFDGGHRGVVERVGGSGGDAALGPCAAAACAELEFACAAAATVGAANSCICACPARMRTRLSPRCTSSSAIPLSATTLTSSRISSKVML